MSEYVKLEDAMDLAKTGRLVSNGNYKSVCKALESLPTTEIVRCKDCKHWKTFKFCTQTVKECAILDGRLTGENDYCCWGKKQVTGKLKNADDSLFTVNLDGLKEQKSKLETVDTPTDSPTNAPTDLIPRQAAINAIENTDVEITAEEWDELTNAIESLSPVEDMGEVSDGYHTFNQLYHQRAVLFATIVNQNKDKAWKSWKHEDGQFCFGKGGEWFIVGIDTPEGSYTYHYEQKYWDMFDCEELERGKHWDGHTEDDVTRLLSLPPAEPKRPHGEWIEYIDDRNGRRYCKCTSCNKTTLNAIEYDVFDGERHSMNFCPNCGADMRGADDD